MAATQLHPWVWEVAARLWDNGHRKEAVDAAASALFDHQLPAKLGIPRGTSAKGHRPSGSTSLGTTVENEGSIFLASCASILSRRSNNCYSSCHGKDQANSRTTTVGEPLPRGRLRPASGSGPTAADGTTDGPAACHAELAAGNVEADQRVLSGEVPAGARRRGTHPAAALGDCGCLRDWSGHDRTG